MSRFFCVCCDQTGHGPRMYLAEEGTGILVDREGTFWDVGTKNARRFRTRAETDTARANLHENVYRKSWVREEETKDA